METDWRPAPNADTLYVSDTGLVKDLYGNVLMADYVNEYGIPIMIVNDGMTNNHIPVWNLVFKAFVENASDAYGVEFIDGDPNNAHIDNLMFYDLAEGGRSYFPKRWIGPDGRLRRRIDRRRKGRVEIVETGEIFASASEVAERIGGQQPNVHAVLQGARRSHKGYTFRYVEPTA